MDIICSFADRDNVLIHWILGCVIGWPILLWFLAYHGVRPRKHSIGKYPRDIIRYPYDRPWDYVRALYRDLKNEDGRYNANIIGLILVVIPYVGIYALMCPVGFVLFMMGIDYLLC